MGAPAQNLGTEILGTLAGFTNNFVAPYAIALTGGLAPIVTAGIVIFLFFRGWAIIRGDAQETFPALTRDAFRIAFILAIGLAAGVYVDLVANTLFAMRDWLVEIMLSGRTLAGLIDQIGRAHV